MKSPQERLHDILWKEIASGDVGYAIRDIVQEFANAGFAEIAKEVKRQVRKVKVD